MTTEETDMNAPNNLHEAMKAATAEVATTPLSTEIERLIATGERLLKNQQERLLNEESTYQQERMLMADGYRVAMERMRQEAEEQFRALDQRHDAKMTAIRNLIAKLKAMREA